MARAVGDRVTEQPGRLLDRREASTTSAAKGYSRTDVNVPVTALFIPGNGSGNVYVQDKGPGRPVDHVQTLFDAAELGIVMDALTHPGQVDLTRVPNAVCGQLYAPGINPIDATTGIASLDAKTTSGIVLGEKAAAEPPLRPYAHRSM